MKVRNSNLELYRIIVMLAIVAHHYVVNSGLGGAISEHPFSPNSLFFYLFGMWGKTGINCFVLITGYFMCQQQITLRKFLKLVLQVMFYNAVLGAVFLYYNYEVWYLGGSHHSKLVQFLFHLLPVNDVKDSFTSCFILFYLTIPFLNAMIKNLNQKMHRNLIALFLFIYTVMPYVPGTNVGFNYVSWFIVLYFISSYIRLYPESIYRSGSAKVWGALSLIAVLMAMGSVVFFCWRNAVNGTESYVYWLVADSNAIFALLVGVTTFLFFKNLKVPQSKLINTIGSTTFGVLLIHTNCDAMRQWLWRETVDSIGHYGVPLFYLYAPVVVLAIFAACSLIDFVRIHTFENWAFLWIDKKISTKDARRVA